MSSGEARFASGFERHLALVRDVGGKTIRLERRFIAALSIGDLICRPQVVGVCGTDLQILLGLREDTARVLGHEGLVIVDAVTTCEDEAWLGMAVVLNPTDVLIGGAELGHTLDGLMQQRLVIPARLRSLAIPAPLGLTAELAALAEPLASVLECIGVLAKVTKPEKVIIVGRGTVGNILSRALPSFCASVREVMLIGTKGDIPFGDPTFDTAILCSSVADFEPAMRIGLDSLREEGLLYLFGGIPPHRGDHRLPGANLCQIRSRHIAGRYCGPIPERVVTAAGRRIFIAGHRGCSNGSLTRAMQHLVAHGDDYRHLLTIIKGPEEAVTELQNFINNHSSRQWTKLGIDLRGW